MIFLDFRKAFFISTTVLILLEIKTSAHNQNISESNNVELFNTTLSRTSSQIFKSTNINGIHKQKGISNGRMRSFTHEEEEQEERYMKIYSAENEISDSGSDATKQNIKYAVKLVATQKPTKPETNSSYLYPIFHYRMDFDLIENNSTNDTNVESNESLFSNITKTDSEILKNYSENKLKSNKSKLIKIVKPRYRYISSQSIHSTEKPMKKFENNYTLMTLNPKQSNLSDVEKEFSNISATIGIKTEKLIQDNNESSTSKHLQSSNREELSDKNEISSPIFSLNETEISKSFENYRSLTNNSERFCIFSTDCYVELNERCITHSKYSVCGCKEPFFREPITHKCQIKKLIRLIFKISSFNYSNELNNTNSFEYIRMKHLIERAIWSAIMNSSHLLTIVENIKVVKFSPLLVMVDFHVKIANPTNSFHHRYMEYHFWYKLMSIIKGININQKPTDKLSALDLKAIEIDNNINYCLIKELNYCSENAICIENHNSESKFQCKCKKGLTDLSPNVNFSGEICAITCNSDFCGTGGFCEIRDGTHLHCICTNWSFGSRCQYSTHVLLSVCALLVILLILFAFCCASVYCGHKIQLEFNGLRSMIENTSNMENTLRMG